MTDVDMKAHGVISEATLAADKNGVVTTERIASVMQFRWVEPGVQARTEPLPLVHEIRNDPTANKAMNHILREERREERRRENAGLAANVTVQGKALRRRAPRIRVWRADDYEPAHYAHVQNKSNPSGGSTSGGSGANAYA